VAVTFLSTPVSIQAFFSDADFALVDSIDVESAQHYISSDRYLYTDKSDWYLMEIEIVKSTKSRTVFVGSVIEAKSEVLIGKNISASIPTNKIKSFSAKEYYTLLLPNSNIL